MIDQQHPITPPSELVEQWVREWTLGSYRPNELYVHIANCAAQWGADQELEACCEQLDELQLGTCYPVTGNKLYAARRPKPPTMKKEALKRLESLEKLAEACGHDPDDTIRRALEQLND